MGRRVRDEAPIERTCTCGDVEDEHGGDPAYPGSTACNCEGCACVAFEHDTEVVSASHVQRLQGAAKMRVTKRS